ncbi:hypothetical protein B0H14DRAFT_2373395 [Mycena olivaceomarginata]|nr:hypothetical protein B0H14DRAFT_2373395 [Mycena olivaceomarginata]
MKPTSKTIVSDSRPKSLSTPQATLKLVMKDEIGSQAWEFDTTRISRLLSPKEQKQGGNRYLLADYDCQVDNQWFQDAVKVAETKLKKSTYRWPTTTGERDHYDPLVQFLNDCVEHGGKALGHQRGALYAHLHFIKYDKEMGDGVGGAYALKPDLAGVVDSKPGSRSKTDVLYWSPPSTSEERNRMHIPIEVKKEWPEMVQQAATYGRCLFSANPSRKFSLVPAYNHITHEFRFLVLHRSGVTSHAALDLATAAGRTQALRLVMTILLWSDPHDAGFISMSNNFEYLVPQDSQSGLNSIRASVAEVLHNSVCVRGRATGVYLLACEAAESPTVVPTTLVPTSQSTTIRRSQRLIESATKPGANMKSSTSKAAKSKAKSSTSKAVKTADLQKANDNAKHGAYYLPISPHLKLNHTLKWTAPTVFTPGKGSLKPGDKLILKSSWQVDSRKSIERDVFSAANGSFGTPVVLCSYEGVHPTGEPISNHLFLPLPEEMKDVHWNIFNVKVPDVVEARSLCFTAFTTIGVSLVHAPSSYALCRALVDAMLGWLSMYQSGYQHRDVSIGNVLLATSNWFPPPFVLESSSKILTATLPSIGEPSVNIMFGQMNIQGHPATTFAEEITQLVETLQVGKECTAFITDGDMAIEWETYFDKSHDFETRSGTPEFMALGLHDAMAENGKYLQSPLDDIESFFWLACWAVLFNDRNENKQRSQIETKWQESLLSGDPDIKRSFVGRLAEIAPSNSWSQILREFHPLFKAWWAVRSELQQRWTPLVEEQVLQEMASDYRKQYLLYHFHHFALEGVKGFLSVAAQHHARLQSCKHFDSSA